MKEAKGRVFCFGENVDTDVIIPARYLASSEPEVLAAHCMEDIDASFAGKVKKGDIIVAGKISAAVLRENTRRLRSRPPAYPV